MFIVLLDGCTYLPHTHVIARRAKPDVAIRSPKCYVFDYSASNGARFRGNGLPRRFAPRNDRVIITRLRRFRTDR
jgi:hypothetical protein